MGLLPNTETCGLRVCRECRARFPRHRFPRKPLVSDPGMHHDTFVTHVSWCMSGSPTRAGGENVPGIPCACATRNSAYLVSGPWLLDHTSHSNSNSNFSPYDSQQCICHDSIAVVAGKIAKWALTYNSKENISIFRSNCDFWIVSEKKSSDDQLNNGGKTHPINIGKVLTTIRQTDVAIIQSTDPP